MPDNAHVFDQLPAFALGSLDHDEVAQVEQHLSSCLICRDELKGFQDAVGQLSFAAPLAAPSPALKERLMQRVQATKPQPNSPDAIPARPWFERLLPAWGLASLVLILALGAMNLLLWQRFNHIEFLTSSAGMRAVPLSPSDASSPATGFVLVSADGSDGALIVDGLPQLDESQQYQLWLFRNGERTSGAVFSTDENAYGGTRIRAPESLLEYSAVGITVEPAGGSAQPTGRQVLAGLLPNP